MESLQHIPLFDASFQLGPAQQVGFGPDGARTILPVESGSFHGPRMKGHFLAGGADWARVRADGSIAIDTRATAQTDDGALIYIQYQGRIPAPPELLPQLLDFETAHLVDPDRYYFRVTPYFETGHPDYAWLNATCAVGVGRLGNGGVAYRMFQIL